MAGQYPHFCEICWQDELYLEEHSTSLKWNKDQLQFSTGKHKCQYIIPTHHASYRAFPNTRKGAHLKNLLLAQTIKSLLSLWSFLKTMESGKQIIDNAYKREYFSPCVFIERCAWFHDQCYLALLLTNMCNNVIQTKL